MSLFSKKMALFTTIAIFFIILDRACKSYFYLLPQQTWSIFSWLKLKLSLNQAIAFSIPLTGILLNILSLIIILLFLIFFITTYRQKRIQTGWILFIILGASSNFFDRLYYKAVIDYIDVQYFSVFNLADSLIVIGIFAILYLELFSKTKNTLTTK